MNNAEMLTRAEEANAQAAEEYRALLIRAFITEPELDFTDELNRARRNCIHTQNLMRALGHKFSSDEIVKLIPTEFIIAAVREELQRDPKGGLAADISEALKR